MTKVITGSSSGIGQELYKKLSLESEEKIICISRTKPNILRSNDLWIKSDLSEKECVSETIDTIKNEKEVSLLVHCAGLMNTKAGYCLDYDEIDSMFRVNVIAPMIITSLLAKKLAKSKGKVVFISSIAAELDIPGEIGYGTTKAAVNKMMHAFNSELNRLGITFFAVSPSFVKTNMTSKIDENQKNYMINKQTNNHELHVSEIADIIVEISKMNTLLSGTCFKSISIKK